MLQIKKKWQPNLLTRYAANGLQFLTCFSVANQPDPTIFRRPRTRRTSPFCHPNM